MAVLLQRAPSGGPDTAIPRRRMHFLVQPPGNKTRATKGWQEGASRDAILYPVEEGLHHGGPRRCSDQVDGPLAVEADGRFDGPVLDAA